VVREAAEVTVRNGQSGSFDSRYELRWSSRQDAALDEAIGRAADGIPTVLLIEGTPGTGKSTFLRRVAVSAQGFRLLQLQADRDWQQPYAALAEWGVLDAPDPGLTSLQAARMLRSWIEKTRSGAPVLIVIDDLEFLDTESSDMIARLVERTFSDRLLVAAAASSPNRESLDPWNRLLIDADRAVHVELTGLEQPAAAELVATAWPGADDVLSNRLWTHTSGNPLFLQAILREHTLEEVRTVEELPAPRDLVRTFAARLARLDADGASLLRAVVTLGDRWTSSLTAGALADLDDPTDAVERLCLQGLLVSRGRKDRSQIRAASGVIAAAVADAIPPAERRALHRRAAALVDSPVDALRHRFLAAGGYDEDLAGELETAAWSLHLAGHPQQASRVGRWASELTGDPAARERRFHDALFDAVLARDLDSVERQLDLVGDARDEARQKLVAGFALVGRRRWARASAIFWSIPAAQIEATDQRTRLRLRILRAWTQLVTGGSVDRARQELALVGDADSTADPRMSGYFGFASAVADDARVTGSPARLAGGPELDDAWHGTAAAIGGLPDVAVRNLKPFVARIDDGLLTMGEGEFHALLGYAYWLRGDWPEARELIRTSLRARYGAVNPMVRAVTVLADVAAGDRSALAQHREKSRAALRDAPWPAAISMAATAEFVCLRLTGASQEQARYLHDLDADFGAMTWPGTRPPLWLLTSGMVNAAAQRPEAVRDLADELARHPSPIGWREAGAAWLRGLGAEAGGDLQEAAQSLSEANARGMADLRIHAALLAGDLARVRRGLGDEAGAASAQRASDDRLAKVDGAQYLIVPAADPLAPLSDREREVVALLTQGLSYAQIAKELYVSRSTVAFHLSNIYAKTATGSRHELTELVRRG
jgi:DNA-binding CsgD family transcriptional regulator